MARKAKTESGTTSAPAGKSARSKGKSFALLIGDEGGILVFMDGSKVVRRLFAPSPKPDSTQAMLQLMRDNPTAPLTLLVDTMDQQFIRQGFPPVSSLSVNGLVKRRLSRDFQPEDLKGALPLGREKIGRKEWLYLLIALAKTTLLTEWIDLVSELPNEFTGIYSVPVETSVYIDTINSVVSPGTAKPWQLFVTHNKVSGFRQVVTNEGNLIFTRVTQALDDAVPAVIAGNIEQEISNTIEYLRRLDFKDNDGLDMIVVASQDVNNALDLKRFNLGNTHALSPLDIADKLGLEQAALSADRFGDVVMAAVFIRNKKRILKFSTAYAEKLAKLYTAKRWIKNATILIVLAILGLSVSNILTMSDNKAAADQATAKKRGLETQAADLKKSVDGLDKNVALKSAVVTAYDAYLKDAPLPQDFAANLAASLTAEFRLVSLEWRVAATTASATAKTLVAATATPAPNAKAPATGPLVIRADIEFKGTYDDTEVLSRAAQTFLTKLQADMPDYAVDHEPFPWLTSTDKNVEISFNQKQAAGIKSGDNHVVYTFTGPLKPKSAPASPAKGATP